jgi:multidrug efflux pump
MTSFAFILGVVPLLVSHGAGAEMRRNLGMAVFSGMLGVTLFGIFLTPVFFYVIDLLGEVHLVHSAAMVGVNRWLAEVNRYVLAGMSMVLAGMTFGLSRERGNGKGKNGGHLGKDKR